MEENKHIIRNKIRCVKKKYFYTIEILENVISTDENFKFCILNKNIHNVKEEFTILFRNLNQELLNLELKIFIPYDQENVLCISEFINYENEYYFDKEKIHCSIESLLIEIFGIIQNYIFRNIKDEENKLCEQLNLINI
jgi:hypothetical protein